MEHNRIAKNKAAAAVEDQYRQADSVKVVQWEDFEQELARLVSLSSALSEAKQKKLLLQQKLDSLIQVEAESLNQSNQLDEMCEKLESQKLVMGNTSMHVKVVEENVKKEEERLSNEIRSLLVAGTALSLASKHLQKMTNGFPKHQFTTTHLMCSCIISLLPRRRLICMESNRLLTGEKGYLHLRNVQRLLRVRQQYMISQVSFLYPVKVMVGHARDQELESFMSNRKSGNSAGSKPVDPESLTISGLHLTVLPFKTSFFTDKKDIQRSATALGYVAHAVSIIATYLEVPLRYPLRLGGSRSYIIDYAPSLESSSSDSTSNSLLSSNLKPTEFPLFLDGQETTRAAYAVFLLNKDIEQLLNFIGVKSLGPRHVLANLKELLRTILSAEYIDT